MKVYYSEAHRRHDPPFEVFDGGLRTPYLENPDRMDRILQALRKTEWAEFHEPSDFGLDSIYAVHDRDYVSFLASAWTEWLDSNPKDSSVLLPATFALRRDAPKPTSLLGRAGYYMMDLSACIVAETFTAALSSANSALSAAQAVSDGDQSVFALCRPPGHHAGKDYAGGYCFINNASVAAQLLSMKGTVALLDVDYHCGNGTQDIFYARDDVLTLSIHADPAFEYPHFIGYSNERGRGRGFGYHHNLPLPTGTNDVMYLSTLDNALEAIRSFKPNFLVISAGMDIYGGDPLGSFKLTTDGIQTIGKQIASLGVPSVIIMEGGYNNDALGRNITAFLGEFR